MKTKQYECTDKFYEEVSAQELSNLINSCERQERAASKMLRRLLTIYRKKTQQKERF